MMDANQIVETLLEAKVIGRSRHPNEVRWIMSHGQYWQPDPSVNPHDMHSLIVQGKAQISWLGDDRYQLRIRGGPTHTFRSLPEKWLREKGVI